MWPEIPVPSHVAFASVLTFHQVKLTSLKQSYLTNMQVKTDTTSSWRNDKIITSTTTTAAVAT
jgi:ribosomal protein L21